LQDEGCINLRGTTWFGGCAALSLQQPCAVNKAFLFALGDWRLR